MTEMTPPSLVATKDIHYKNPTTEKEEKAEEPSNDILEDGGNYPLSTEFC
jgi:hypothetical protein